MAARSLQEFFFILLLNDWLALELIWHKMYINLRLCLSHLCSVSVAAEFSLFTIICTMITCFCKEMYIGCYAEQLRQLKFQPLSLFWQCAVLASHIAWWALDTVDNSLIWWKFVTYWEYKFEYPQDYFIVPISHLPLLRLVLHLHWLLILCQIAILHWYCVG